ncbi:MAG: choice-of-anchor X domain-containing protein [Caldilineaceae bacterium]
MGALTGADQQWQMNHFTVPVTKINFPSDPGNGQSITPAANLIQIDIDTANPNAEIWCTAVDWLSLQIEIVRPVLFLHGIFSDASIWGKTWIPRMKTLGIPHDAINLGAASSFDKNARLIDTHIKNLQKRWGIQKLNLVTHSKGGLDARHYIQTNDTVDQLLQIGTPNAGSPLADITQDGAKRMLGLLNSAIIERSLAAGGKQLTLRNMARFNANYRHNPKTTITALAGNYLFRKPLTNLLLARFYRERDKSPFGQHDKIVPVWSVYRLPVIKRVGPFASIGRDEQATHNGLHSAAPVLVLLEPLLKTPKATVAAATVNQENITGTVSTPVATFDGDEVIQRLLTIADTVSLTQTSQQVMLVDEGIESIGFMLTYLSGDLDLTLTSPSGLAITQTTALPNVGFGVMEEKGGYQIELYGIENPEPGAWALTVAATAVADATGQEVYVLSTVALNPAIQLQAGAGQTPYTLGDTIAITATVQDVASNLPIANASAVAKVIYPDDETWTFVPLTDTGVGADSTAGDGIYTGVFTSTVGGTYDVLVQVTGEEPSRFEREETLSVEVANTTARLAQGFAPTATDATTDGMWDSLAFTMQLDVTPHAGLTTTLRLVADLTDDTGNLITTAATDFVAGSGAITQTLYFDGEDLFTYGQQRGSRPGENSALTVANVRLFAGSGSDAILLDTLPTATTTTAYSYSQFQDPALPLGPSIPGDPPTRQDGPIIIKAFAEAVLDTDGDSLYNELWLEFTLCPKIYEEFVFTGELIDVNGAFVEQIETVVNFTAEETLVRIPITGTTLGDSTIGGALQVRNLTLADERLTLPLTQTFATRPYSFSRFEGAIPFTVMELVRTELVRLIDEEAADLENEQVLLPTLGHIERSLQPTLWQDGTTLTLEGATVFKEIQRATNLLSTPVLLPRMAVSPTGQITNPQLLVDAARLLAQVALDEAVAAGRDGEALAAAQAAKQAAEAFVTAGAWSAAVEQFQQVWLQSLLAIGATPVLEEHFLYLPVVVR